MKKDHMPKDHMQEIIEEDGKKLSIPEELLPENILMTIQKVENSMDKEKCLQENEEKEEKEEKQETSRKPLPWYRKYRGPIAGGLVAATLLLTLGIHQGFPSLSPKKASSTMRMTTQGSAAAESCEEGKMTMEEESRQSLTLGEGVLAVTSYEEVAKAYQEAFLQDDMEYWTYGALDDAVLSGVVDSAVTSSAMNIAEVNIAKENTEDYSTTNVMTEGVDEADLIKTNGSYIYYAKPGYHWIEIYQAKDGSLTFCGKMDLAELSEIQEIYMDEQYMIVTGLSYQDLSYDASVVLVDLTNPEEGRVVDQWTQEGNRFTTRKVGDRLYVISTKTSTVKADASDELCYIPKINESYVSVDHLILEEEVKTVSSTTISSIFVGEKLEAVDDLTLAGFGGTTYMTEDALYLYRTDYDYNEEIPDVTKIRKIAMDPATGQFTALYCGEVSGSVRDAFAVNAYEGMLRIMTTTSSSYERQTTSNQIYVLDETLQVMGNLGGLAPGERIYSARYFGNTAYMVTYRETDPLFSIDLTDPTHPKVLGALKIPGFSEYLHGYGEGLLLGLGVIDGTSENHWKQSLKLSMFDITDSTDVKEHSVYVVPDAADSNALMQYKALMIDPEKNLFGFSTWNYDADWKGRCFYRIYTYDKDNKTFKELGKVLLGEDQYDSRAVYIGDYVYVFWSEGYDTIALP